jgi:hypothetical protein
MDLLDGYKLSKLCDYSFGDQSGRFGNIFNSFMKDANLSNLEFAAMVEEISSHKSVMTLFIDNIRLYRRQISSVKKEDVNLIRELMANNDLLDLVSNFDKMNFIIFTNLEDTPIDEFVHESIPNNVKAISAVNAESFGGKVFPAPYGLKRQMHPGDNKNELLKNLYLSSEVKPGKLLYVNHTIETNKTERTGINELFRWKKWATVDKRRIKFDDFVSKILNHKFMICPIGNALDCHRNWEVIYLRRVPIMKRHPYLVELFKDLPVLFVEDFKDVSEELLERNNYLFEMIQTLNLAHLTLPKFYEDFVALHSAS